MWEGKPGHVGPRSLLPGWQCDGVTTVCQFSSDLSSRHAHLGSPHSLTGRQPLSQLPASGDHQAGDAQVWTGGGRGPAELRLYQRPASLQRQVVPEWQGILQVNLKNSGHHILHGTHLIFCFSYLPGKVEPMTVHDQTGLSVDVSCCDRLTDRLTD